jgi:hypothetical protein
MPESKPVGDNLGTACGKLADKWVIASRLAG